MSELFKLGEVYYCYVLDAAGERHQRSMGCTDKRAAEARRRLLEREAIDPLFRAQAAATVTTAVQLLVSTREEQARRPEERGHGRVLPEERRPSGARLRGQARLGRLSTFPSTQLDAPAVDDYVSTRRAEGVGEDTISKELVTLRAALKLARRAKVWMGDPDAIMPIAFSPECKPRERFLSRDELHKLLGALTEDRAARVAFIVATSACASEAEHALRKDVGKENSVLLRGTKRPSRWRTVPIEMTWQRSLLAHALKHAQGRAAGSFSLGGTCAGIYSSRATPRASILAAPTTCGARSVIG